MAYEWIELYSGGGGIIEVNQLPTENIDKNAFYVVDGKYYKWYGSNPYVFNDEISVPTEMHDTSCDFEFSVNTPDGGVQTLTGMYFDYTEAVSYYNDTDDIWLNNVWEQGWIDEAYKTIDIHEMPTDETFIAWLNANATKVDGWQEYVSFYEADALPSQVVKGAKFVGANGVVEEGTIPIYDLAGIECYKDGVEHTDTHFAFTGEVSQGCLVEDIVNFKVSREEFGNAAQSDVREGVSFTSTAGIQVNGTGTDAEYDIRMSLFGDEGYVAVEGTNVTLNEEAAKPSSGYYIKANGRGKVVGCGEAIIKSSGYIDEGSKIAGGEDIETPDDSIYSWSNTATKYYTVATEEKTVTSSTSAQTVTPTSGKLLSKVTVNAIGTANQATPSISVSSAGLITASATQTAGYVSAGTKSKTKQLTVQAAKTVTPTTSDQTAVASGRYTTGAVTVKGDANLKAENIKKGVTIFGVTGTYEPTTIVTCTLQFYTELACDSVEVTYIKNGASTTTVIPDNSVVSIEVDCNTSITISCESGNYFTNSPWGYNLYYDSPCTLTTPAESGVYNIVYDNS